MFNKDDNLSKCFLKEETNAQTHFTLRTIYISPHLRMLYIELK